MELMEKIFKSCEKIRQKVEAVPKISVILGSGLGGLAGRAENAVSIPYGDIPHFQCSTAPGHAGRLVFGTLNGVPCVLMQGRLHCYEGWSMQDTVYPVQVLRALGVQTLVVTNAAGGIHPSFFPGAFMLISDHIKLCADNPLRGANIDAMGPRFFDMTNAYDKGLRTIAKNCAKKCQIPLFEGVYAYMSGPCFETPAEIRALSILGADAVGMSTVPEVIAANHAGMRVLGISCITNMAAGITGAPITSEEVNQTGEAVSQTFTQLMETILCKI